MFRILLIIFTFFVCSCSLSESVDKGKKIMQIGEKILYKSDLQKIIPKGISTTDSIALVNKYINSWSIKQLLLLKAEKYLPEEERDVDELLENYRTQLLIYKYEKMYLEERIDTLVTIEERENYYNSNPDKFIGKHGLIKGRIIKMLNSSPNLQIIKNLSKGKKIESIIEVEELAKNSATKYNNFNNQWADLNIVANEIGITYPDIKKKIENRGAENLEFKDSLYTTIVQIIDFVKWDKLTPFDYNSDKIKEIIISKRKQNMLSELYDNVLQEALKNKNLKLVQDEKNNK